MNYEYIGRQQEITVCFVIYFRIACFPSNCTRYQEISNCLNQVLMQILEATKLLIFRYFSIPNLHMSSNLQSKRTVTTIWHSATKQYCFYKFHSNSFKQFLWTIKLKMKISSYEYF